MVQLRPDLPRLINNGVQCRGTVETPREPGAVSGLRSRGDESMLKRLRRWAVTGAALLVLGAAMAPVPAAAQADEDKKINLELKDVPLRTAIEAIFKGSGLQHQVYPNVPVVPVTL